MAGSSILLAANVAVRVLSVFSIAILARLLTPEDYGVVALALVVIAFADLLTDLHFSDALIRAPEVRDHDFDTVFTMALIRGVLSGAAIFLMADTIAAAMDTPELADVLRWSALAPVINSLQNPRFVMFARNLQFRPRVMMVLTTRLTTTVVSIVAAFQLRDYWALIIGSLCASGAGVALTYALSPGTPRLGLRGWREFFAFGGWLTASGFVSFINGKLDTVAIGAALDTRTLGFFSMGENIASMGTFQMSQPLLQTIYPALAAVGGDHDRLRRAYYRAQGCVVCLLMPVGVGAAVTADELIVVVVGAQWLQAGDVVRVLAPLMAFGMMVTAVQGLLRIKGGVHLLLYRNMAQLALKAPLIAAGLWLAGLDGLLTARIALAIFFTLSMLALAARYTGDTMFTPIMNAWRSAVASLAMAAAALATGTWIAAPFEPEMLPAAVRLVQVGGVAAAVYVAVHLCLWRLVGSPEGAETTIISGVAQIARGLLRRVPRRRP